MSKEIIVRCPFCGAFNRRYRIYVYKGALIRCDACGELFKHEAEDTGYWKGLRVFMEG
jgi:uncharacterized C2H2 Zn-finger protein